MIKEAADLLFHPRIFFRQKNQESPGLLVPAVIVGIGGVVTYLSPLLVVAVTRGGDISRFHVEASATLFFLLLPFALWLISAGALFVVGRLLSGTGSFPVTLQNCGYGYLPQTLLSSLVFINGVTLPWIAGMQPSIVLKVVAVILGFGLILGVIWSGALWTVAMETTHGLPRFRAMAGPAIIVLFSLLPLILIILTEGAARVPLP